MIKIKVSSGKDSFNLPQIQHQRVLGRGLEDPASSQNRRHFGHKLRKQLSNGTEHLPRLLLPCLETVQPLILIGTT